VPLWQVPWGARVFKGGTPGFGCAPYPTGVSNRKPMRTSSKPRKHFLMIREFQLADFLKLDNVEAAGSIF
jgi:hypothetical protein